jgi:hypothetical protein
VEAHGQSTNPNTSNSQNKKSHQNARDSTEGAGRVVGEIKPLGTVGKDISFYDYSTTVRGGTGSHGVNPIMPISLGNNSCSGAKFFTINKSQIQV